MELNMSKVSKAEGITEKFDIREILPDGHQSFGREEFVVVSPIVVLGSMVNFEGKIRVDFNISTDVNRICSRCLKEYTEKVDTNCVYTFVKSASDLDTDSDYILLDGDTVFIDELIVNEIMAGLTMKPLCSKDCKGICPVCGKNKNIEQCNCSSMSDADPRFSVLNNLFQSK